MRISAVETPRYGFTLDPPFHAAWDPVPRSDQDATVVLVHTDEGVTGYASGDDLSDRELLERLLVGVDPLRTEGMREVVETVDFHGARPWTVEIAVWDLVGRALDSRSGSCSAAAPSGWSPTPRAASWSTPTSARGAASRCATEA